MIFFYKQRYQLLFIMYLDNHHTFVFCMILYHYIVCILQWSSSSSTEKPLTFIIGVNSNSIENGYGGVLIINNVRFLWYWARLHPENKSKIKEKLMKTWYNFGFIIGISNT